MHQYFSFKSLCLLTSILLRRRRRRRRRDETKGIKGRGRNEEKRTKKKEWGRGGIQRSTAYVNVLLNVFVFLVCSLVQCYLIWISPVCVCVCAFLSFFFYSFWVILFSRGHVAFLFFLLLYVILFLLFLLISSFK